MTTSTPEGMIPSGNLSLYWNEVQPEDEVIHASFQERSPASEPEGT